MADTFFRSECHHHHNNITWPRDSEFGEDWRGRMCTVLLLKVKPSVQVELWNEYSMMSSSWELKHAWLWREDSGPTRHAGVHIRQLGVNIHQLGLNIQTPLYSSKVLSYFQHLPLRLRAGHHTLPYLHIKSSHLPLILMMIKVTLLLLLHSTKLHPLLHYSALSMFPSPTLSISHLYQQWWSVFLLLTQLQSCSVVSGEYLDNRPILISNIYLPNYISQQ